MDLLQQAADLLAESRSNALTFAGTEIDLGVTLIGLAVQEYEMKEVEIAGRSIIDAAKACDIANQILERLSISKSGTPESDSRRRDLEYRIAALRAQIREAIRKTGFRAKGAR